MFHSADHKIARIGSSIYIYSNETTASVAPAMTKTTLQIFRQEQAQSMNKHVAADELVSTRYCKHSCPQFLADINREIVHVCIQQQELAT